MAYAYDRPTVVDQVRKVGVCESEQQPDSETQAKRPAEICHLQDSALLAEPPALDDVRNNLYIIDGVVSVRHKILRIGPKGLCGARRATVLAEGWHPSMSRP